MKASLGLAAVVLLASASSAYALDNKAYPGGACKPVSSSTGSYVILIGTDFIQNTAAVQSTFSCPIVRDEVQGNTAVRVLAFVTDASATAAVTCTARSVDPAGLVVGFATGTTTPAFTGDATLSMIVNPTGPLVGNAYNLQCSLPPGSRVRSYVVTENEQVD